MKLLHKPNLRVFCKRCRNPAIFIYNANHFFWKYCSDYHANDFPKGRSLHFEPVLNIVHVAVVNICNFECKTCAVSPVSPMRRFWNYKYHWNRRQKAGKTSMKSINGQKKKEEEVSVICVPLHLRTILLTQQSNNIKLRFTVYNHHINKLRTDAP